MMKNGTVSGIAGFTTVLMAISLTAALSLAPAAHAIGITIADSSKVGSEGEWTFGYPIINESVATSPSFPKNTFAGTGNTATADWSFVNEATSAVFSGDTFATTTAIKDGNCRNYADLTFTVESDVDYSLSGGLSWTNIGGHKLIVAVQLTREGESEPIFEINKSMTSLGEPLDKNPYVIDEIAVLAKGPASGVLPAGTYTLEFSFGVNAGFKKETTSLTANFTMTLEGSSDPILEILQPPQSHTAEPGSTATFTVITGGIEGETFEWKHRDTVVGGDSATLTLSDVQASDAGQYTVNVTAGEKSVSSRAVTLGIKAPPYTEKMLNISTRGQILTGSKVMIAGFVLEGSGQKNVLIRGIGPALGSFGVNGVCTDPKLTLFHNTNPATPSIAENEEWGSMTGDIVGATVRVGGFLLPDGSKDAVLYMNLNPGAYTAKVSGMDGTGVGLVELYDADPDSLASTCNLSNISTRGEVGTGAQMLIAGFVITGEVPMQVLVRGIGPKLADFQVDGTLSDPFLRIVKNATPEALWVASNDNWSDNPNAVDIVTASTAIGAFGLTDGSKDAAILTRLEPGVYTAQVSGVDDGTGVALVEVYEVK